MNHKHILSTLLLSWVVAPAVGFAADYIVGDTFSDSLRSGGTGPQMAVIPSGIFVLGGGRGGEDEQGTVKIDYMLAVGATEVTVGQYRQFLTASLSGNLRKLTATNDSLPMSGVSFDEAEAYVTWLSRATGNPYRLPSASEWEYAARAGTSTVYSWGNEVGENNANCLDCKSANSGVFAPAGSFPANDWGLHDMHGNVWEWTKDCIDSNMATPNNGMPVLFGNCDLRELRGGSANSDGSSIRAGARASAMRQANSSDVGFRVVMDIR